MNLPKFKPFLRVQAYLSVVAFIVLGAKLGFAYKSTEKTLKDVGGQLAGYLKMSVNGVEAVSINGERFAFAVTMTDRSVDEVLSTTEQACAKNSGNISEELQPIIDQAKKDRPQLGSIDPSKLTTLRRDAKHGAESGDVTCFTRPNEAGRGPEHPGFLARMERFTDTLSLGELGEAHYLRADREPKINQTRVLYVRSLGELKLSNLFGGDGDTPGRDPKDIPRPLGSVRTFSAAIERNEDGFYSYESSEAPAAVLSFYEQKLGKDWEKMALDGNEPELRLARAFARDDRAAYVMVDPRRDGGSDVGLVVLQGGGQATATVTR